MGLVVCKIHHRDAENTEEHRGQAQGAPGVRPPAVRARLMAYRSPRAQASRSTARPSERKFHSLRRTTPTNVLFKGFRQRAPESSCTRSVSGRGEAGDKNKFLEAVSLSAVCGRSPHAGRGTGVMSESHSVLFFSVFSVFSVSLWLLFSGTMSHESKPWAPKWPRFTTSSSWGAAQQGLRPPSKRRWPA